MARQRSTVALCPGIVNLRTSETSIPDFQLGPGKDAPREPGPAEVTVTYEVDSVAGVSDIDKGIRVRGDEIIYRKGLGVFGDLRCRIRFDSDGAKLTVNRTYHRLGRRSVSSVPSVGRLLEDIISVQLLRNGYAILYCGGISFDGVGSVLVGLTNTGKTTTVLKLVDEEGADYVAEDIAITDGTELYCCPYAISPVDFESFDGRSTAVSRWVARNVPLLDSTGVESVDSVYDILDRDQIQESTTISQLFVLSPEDSPNSRLDPARSMLLANRGEFSYLTNQILLGAEFLGYGLDVAEACERERQIFETVAANSTVRHLSGDNERLYEGVRRKSRPADRQGLR